MTVAKQGKSADPALAAAIEKIESDLAKFRADIASLTEQRRVASLETMSADEIRHNIKSHLDRLEGVAIDRLIPARFGVPGRNPTADAMFRLATPIFTTSEKFGVTAQNPDLQIIGGLCALGFRNTLEESLIARALSATGGGGPTEAEREAELARIDAELTAAKLGEERIIRSSEDAGMPIARRKDSDPEIYLRREVA